MTRTATVLINAVAHLIVSVVLIATAYALGMSRFDTGAPPGHVKRVVGAAARAFLFPIVTACPARSDTCRSWSTVCCGQWPSSVWSQACGV